MRRPRETGDLHLIGQPGDESEDRTTRLIIESYQMVYRSYFGEGVRLMLMDPNAKNMVAWHDAFSNPDSPKPVAWVGAHFGTHIPGLTHKHWSVETSMADGALHTRFSVTYGEDLTKARFNRSCVTNAEGGVESGVDPSGCGAVRVMEVGPPGSPCRGRLQTTAGCVG